MAARDARLLPYRLCRGDHVHDGRLPDRPVRPCPARGPGAADEARAGRRGLAGGKDAAMTPVLQVSNLRKSFGGITAVDGVSFEVREGEILGIIGPNGSGKSTLFNCVLGQLAPSDGEVRIDGKPTTGMRPCDLNRLGVSRTFQLLQVFPELSVRDNLILAGQEHRGTMASRLIGAHTTGLGGQAAKMIVFFRLAHVADEPAGSLSYGQQSCSTPPWPSWPARASSCSMSRPAAST